MATFLISCEIRNVAIYKKKPRRGAGFLFQTNLVSVQRYAALRRRAKRAAASTAGASSHAAAGSGTTSKVM